MLVEVLLGTSIRVSLKLEFLAAHSKRITFLTTLVSPVKKGPYFIFIPLYQTYQQLHQWLQNSDTVRAPS